MPNNDTLRYIITFLAGDPAHSDLIGYTADESTYRHYRLVIVPSRFFQPDVYGTAASMPVLPLEETDGVPLLFGKAQKEMRNGTLVVHADIVASTYFLISRYEETVNNERDEHQRFAARHSLPMRAGFLHRPIVEEYGKLLRQWLREADVPVCEPQAGFDEIYLTHDVDTVDFYHHLRGTLGGVKRILSGETQEKLTDVVRSIQDVEKDPAYTFPWLMKQDKKVAGARIIYFFKAAEKGDKHDRPLYDLNSRRVRALYNYCRDNHCYTGLHSSYAAGADNRLIREEKERLEQAFNIRVTDNRHHYLRSCSVDDMQALAQAGITDDFTMGYADHTGFRLGTCRAVRWVNPKTGELTRLLLHPLTVMECTLMESRYMNMNYNQAMHTLKQTINRVFLHNGEIVLLWHNTSVANNLHGGYGKLYTNILKYINRLIHADDPSRYLT